MERNEVKAEYKWKTSDLFTSDEEWEKEFSEVEALVDFARFQGTLNSVENLLAFYKAQEEVEVRFLRVYLYAHLKRDEDVRVGKYGAYLAKTMSMYGKLGEAVAFVAPELTSLSDERLQAFAKDERLKAHDYQLSRLLQEKKYILSEREEKLLAKASDALDVSSDTFNMLNDGELNLPEIEYQGERVQLTHGLYSLIMSESDREKRAEAFKLYYSAFRKILNTLAVTYYGNVKKDMFYVRARGYESCLQMALFNEDVERSVYENLVKTVGEYTPVMHRYIADRKKALKLDEMHMYDMSVPLVENAELKLDFEEAYDLVLKGLAPLGEEYISLLKQGKAEGWIDVYETEGKRSGAYSTCIYGMHPYVLLNYQQTTHDVFTIAHEMGHSLHSYFSGKNQPYSKSDYTIFVAEVASTVNEVLLLKYLKNTTKDENLKKYLLNYFLDMIRTTLFRQTQFAQFEEEAHALAESGEPLNRENLSKTYLALNERYYGDAVVHDEEISFEWARIPHFYRSFYVYKYATGIISAITIANRILKEGASAVKDYFAFLSGGCSTDPVSLLKIAGADLTTDTPFRTAMEEFEQTVKEFEALL